MILLDTNVLSAVMQAKPPEAVIAWLNRQPDRAVWTTAVTVFEVEYGLQRLPEGRRRDDLEKAFVALRAQHGSSLQLRCPARIGVAFRVPF